MDGGAWWAAGHGVAKSRTRLSDFTFTFYFHALEKEMATHSSVLAWRIPGTGSLVGCCLWGRKGSEVKVSASNAGDPGLIPGSGRSPGERNGYPIQYSCLENSMDRGAWRATVHGVTKSQTRLSNLTFTFHFHTLEKEMATHSSVLAWRIPGMGEPGGLLSMGSHRVGHD